MILESQRRSEISRLAVHDARCPDQTETALPAYRIGMKYYYWVDVSVDPSVPRDKELTISFGGKIKGEGVYQLTAAE